MEQTPKKPEVIVIPATKRSTERGGQIRSQQPLRVAAYCRVSTGDESQQTSYTTQKRFYTQMIASRPGWTLAGIYADEAISGTSRAKRRQFNEMMEDALGGKMDYIVTKSISRFARNTIDTLECVRQLRQLAPPVGVYFEKENIDTLDATGELILTILSALAQDESRSISDNIRWSIQRKFQRGEPMVDLKRMLGYDSGPRGEWIINARQAATVRYIFDRFVAGVPANAIAGELNAAGETTVRGHAWRADAVLYILRNEKYAGDCESQKFITRSFLTHRATVNRGEAPRYFVRDHHAPIVPRLVFDKAQAILAGHGSQSGAPAHRGAGATVFSNLLCGCEQGGRLCAQPLRRIGCNRSLRGVTDSRSAAAQVPEPPGRAGRCYYYYPVWRCTASARRRPQDMARCTAHTLLECALEQSVMEALYRLRRDWETHGEDCELARHFREACARIGQSTPQAEQTLAQARASYEFFLRYLTALPRTNAAGQPLSVFGLDAPGSRSTAYDLLPFDKGIYRAFIQGGVVRGDVVEYTTRFGVTLVTEGNSRSLSDFLGFRRAEPDHSVTLIDEPWKVTGRGVRLVRSKADRQQGGTPR